MTILSASTRIADVRHASAAWRRLPATSRHRSFPPRTNNICESLRLPRGGQVDAKIFFLCHATPSDPLYEYRAPDSPLWERPEELTPIADIILAGHTHLQFSRRVGERVIANPGSLGQTKAGDPRARYAMWHEGRLDLNALEYPVEKTVAKILSMPLSDLVKRDLIQVLRTGRSP
jgi:Calcineurin-like phosphoesterase superfamily domain